MKFPSRKYVYVFNVKPVSGLIPFLWIGKVGFSMDAEQRSADVERSIFEQLGVRVEVKTFLRVKVFMYRGIEKAVHNVIKPLQSKVFFGASGGTEMFKIFNFITGLLAYMVLYYFGIDSAVWIALCIMLIPYPLDMALFVLLLALFEYAAAVVGIYLILTIAGHLLQT